MIIVNEEKESLTRDEEVDRWITAVAQLEHKFYI